MKNKVKLKPHDIVVIESGVKHDRHTRWNLFALFVCFFLFSFVCFKTSSQKRHRYDNGALQESISIRLTYIQVQTHIFFFTWFSFPIFKRSWNRWGNISCYLCIKKGQWRWTSLYCARNKLATDGDRQPNCILVKIFFPFTRRLSAEWDAGFFSCFPPRNPRKNKGGGEVTHMRLAKLSIPSAASLTFYLFRLAVTRELGAIFSIIIFFVPLI